MKDIRDHTHKDKKRPNNPQVDIAHHDDNRGDESKTYKYDPHLDPSLEWASKAESEELIVKTQSIHVHERINPKSIIDALRKHSADNRGGGKALFG